MHCLHRAASALVIGVLVAGVVAVGPGSTPVQAAAGDFTFFSVPASDTDGPRSATDVTLGPDGNVWFLATSETGADDVVGRVTSGGTIDTFPIGGSGDGQLIAGPDGRLWIASDALYKVQPAGTVVRMSRPGRGSYRALVQGPRDHLWLLMFRKLKELDARGRVLRTFPLPHTANDVALGPDGNLWVTWTFGGVDRVTPSGAVTTFAAPAAPTSPQNLQGIAPGPDGKLWMASYFVSSLPTNLAQVCKVSTRGRYRCFSAPNGVHLVAVGPDGGVYVDGATRFDLNPDRIDPPVLRRYSVDGSFDEFVDASLHDLRALTGGPDDDVWFAQEPGETGATLGRLEVAAPAP